MGFFIFSISPVEIQKRRKCTAIMQELLFLTFPKPLHPESIEKPVRVGTFKKNVICPSKPKCTFFFNWAISVLVSFLVIFPLFSLNFLLGFYFPQFFDRKKRNNQLQFFEFINIWLRYHFSDDLECKEERSKNMNGAMQCPQFRNVK